MSTDKKTILATNDNFVEKDADVKLNEEQRYVGGGIQPKKSEFKKVTEMRKSRQSTNAFANLDLDLTGNTAPYQHMLQNRKNSKGELQHMINLRQYKNTSNFHAEDPWQWPPPKSFSPKDQYLDE